MTPELPAFFESYLAGYVANDCDGIARHFAEPCMICDSNGCHVVRGTVDARTYLDDFLSSLRNAGCTRIPFQILSEANAGEDGLFCSTRTFIERDDGVRLGDMEYHYCLERGANSLLIRFARMGTVRSWNL